MRFPVCLLMPLLTLIGQTANAETLIAPSFPDSSPWIQVSSLPIKPNEGVSKAEVKNFYPASEDKDNPRNIVSITSASGLRTNVGAVEYLTSLAQGLQQHCEEMRATRPTLLLEKRTPVSYARLFCSKIKGADYGVIQTIKVLQGKNNMFAAIREWHVLPFDFQVGPSAPEQFAAKLFKSPSDADTWVQQLASANAHLTNQVFLCAEQQGEFGEPCSSK